MNFEKSRRLLSFMRRAVDDYEMIKDGDRIAVGISGGKDSMALVCIMNELRRFYPHKFELVAITIDTGFEGMDFTPLREFFAEMGIEYIIEKTNIAEIVFNVRKESNPCSLCANMRRGALHNVAVNAGCNKLALGHHFDDVIDTFMLNLIYEGRIGCFSPVTYLSNRDITMIRPMIYAKESDIKYFMKQNNVPMVKSTCPEDKHTKREDVKKLIDSIESDNEGFRHRIFTAIQNGNIDGFHLPEKNRRNKF